MQIRQAVTGQGAGPSKQLMAVLAVAVVMLGVVAYVASPFQAAGNLKCGAAILGASPKERATSGLLVGREDALCQSEGTSRLMVGGIALIVSLILALGAVLLPVGPLEEFFLRRE